MHLYPSTFSRLITVSLIALSGLLLTACGDESVADEVLEQANQPATEANSPDESRAAPEGSDANALSASERALEPESVIEPLSAGEVADQRYAELTWDDLLPADFDFQSVRDKVDLAQYDIQSLTDDDPEAQRLYDDLQSAMADVPFVYALDGQEARIPGFLVPLEMEADAVREFFLVPYFGACIHTPPPPANQIVHVVLDEAIPFDNIYEPYWVSGTLAVTETRTDIGTAGYRMRASGLTLYE